MLMKLTPDREKEQRRNQHFNHAKELIKPFFQGVKTINYLKILIKSN